MGNKESKQDKKIDVLRVAISAITVATPLIYLIGLNFSSGILYGYGVSNSLFPFSIEDNLTAAYYFLAITMFDSNLQGKFFLIIITIIVVTIIVAAVLFLIEYLLKHGYVLIKDKFKTDGFDKNNELNKLKEDKIVDVNVINLTLLILVIAILPLAASVVGKEFSLKRIEGFGENNCTPKDEGTGWSRCVTVIDNRTNKTVAKGLLIAASDNKIAIYSNNKSRILNYSDNYEIFYEYEDGTQ